jgi:secreted Zn-dependent insulinase-like peptidase
LPGSAGSPAVSTTSSRRSSYKFAPPLITGPGEPLEAALKALEGMNQKNWKKVRDTVADQIRQAKKWMDVRIVIE